MVEIIHAFFVACDIWLAFSWLTDTFIHVGGLVVVAAINCLVALWRET